MSKIIFDQKLMQIMSVFEFVTRTPLKDVVEDEGLYLFIVTPGNLAKAVGKKGVNVKNLEHKLKRRVKIVEYSEDVRTFVGNVMYPAKAQEIVEEGGIVTIQPEDHQSRGQMIGRNASYLRFAEKVVKRYFPITEIKVK